MLAQQPVAFDGTVTAVDGDEVTFDVERWFRGGEGDTAVTRAAGLVSGAPELNGGVGFVEGGRYLVSGRAGGRSDRAGRVRSDHGVRQRYGRGLGDGVREVGTP